ncbi:unnamed protein product, partial [Meganyctiphanes norvegica]
MSHSLADLEFNLAGVQVEDIPIPQVYNFSATVVDLLDDVDGTAGLNTWFSPDYPAITTLVLHLGVLPRILALPLLWINQQNIPNVCSVTNPTLWEDYPCSSASVSQFIPDKPIVPDDIPETWKGLASIKGEIQNLEKTICDSHEKIIEELLSNAKIEASLKNLMASIKKEMGDDSAEVVSLDAVSVLQMFHLGHRVLNNVGRMDFPKVLAGVTTSEGTILIDVIKDSVAFDFTLRDGSAVISLVGNVLKQLDDVKCGEVAQMISPYAKYGVDESVFYATHAVEAFLLLDIEKYPFSLASCDSIQGTVKFLLEH